MAREPSDDAAYEVGYGRPPQSSRFPKGRSGNPSGRPRRIAPEELEIGALLTEPVTVTKGGVVRTMSPFEAGLRSLVKRALGQNDLKAARAFLAVCEECGLMPLPPTPPVATVLFYVPRSWDWQEWTEMFRRHGPPPWPGERSGLPGDPPKKP